VITLAANDCKTDGADGVVYAGSGWARGGVCGMAWYASLFRLFGTRSASGRAERMVGLRTQQFADVRCKEQVHAARGRLGYCVYQSTEGLN
jgi:hypothetical protein